MALSKAPCIAIVDLSPFLENNNQEKGTDSKNNLNTKNCRDLKSDGQKRAALKLHEAFQDTGFAIVVNHGIENEKIERLRDRLSTFLGFA